MANKQRLGEILIENGLVSADNISLALRTQVGGNRRLGYILVRMKLISADQVAETLAEQLEIDICDISERYSPESLGLFPRYLCRKYGVLPLALMDNNILEVAMADPCDGEAKNSIEQYTGKVVLPLLARQTDIEREIPIKVPLSKKDFFSPQFSTAITRVGVGVCMVCLLFLAGYTFRYVNESTYGTKEVVGSTRIYKNHDLILEVGSSGSLKFSGRSAFAKGYYSVSFNNKKELEKFLERRRSDFSEKQTGWLGWAVSKG